MRFKCSIKKRTFACRCRCCGQTAMMCRQAMRKFEHGDEFAARELAPNLPRRAPAEAKAFTDPAMQKLPVIAIEIAVHTYSYSGCSDLKCQPRC